MPRGERRVDRRVGATGFGLDQTTRTSSGFRRQAARAERLSCVECDEQAARLHMLARASHETLDARGPRGGNRRFHLDRLENCHWRSYVDLLANGYERRDNASARGGDVVRVGRVRARPAANSGSSRTAPTNA